MLKLPTLQYLKSKLPTSVHHPAMKILLPLAAVGPAALFAVLWKLLNSPFSSYIGEGYDGPAACLIAGVCFYGWIYGGHRKAWKDKQGEGAVRPHIERVYWSLVTATVAIPGGRIIFSFLPPWDNAVGGIIAMMTGHTITDKLFNFGRGRFIHARGTVELSGEEAKQQMERFPAGPEPRIQWAGYDIPGEVAIGNFLTVGAIGTGKTRLHRQLMRSVVPHIHPDTDRRVLIYDVKCDLLSELYGMRLSCEVLVFNPFDRRSVAWDIAMDVRSPEQARHFAEALILPAKGDDKPFFINAARNIIAGVINALNCRCPGEWTLRDLLRVTASKERLRKLLAGTDLIDQYFSPPDTFDNIRNTIANVTVELEAVAALWEQTPRKISLKQWVKKGGSILVLGGKENLQPALEPLNRVAFKIITTDFLSEPESPLRSRLWFFCDELKTAGRLDTLPMVLNARSKGVRAVLGFQDIEGIIDAYGSKEKAFEIAGRSASVSWLKLTSTETAEWASRRTGEFERFEYFDTQTKDGTSVGEQYAKREAVMPSEFLNLPDFSGGNATGVHLIRGVDGVFKSTSHHTFPKTDPADDFHARDESEQILALWTAADDERLGLNDDNDQAGGQASADPRPDEPDLDSLGRVSF
jgi:hypothetical protein